MSTLLTLVWLATQNFFLGIEMNQPHSDKHYLVTVALPASVYFTQQKSWEIILHKFFSKTFSWLSSTFMDHNTINLHGQDGLGDNLCSLCVLNPLTQGLSFTDWGSASPARSKNSPTCCKVRLCNVLSLFGFTWPLPGLNRFQIASYLAEVQIASRNLFEIRIYVPWEQRREAEQVERLDTVMRQKRWRLSLRNKDWNRVGLTNRLYHCTQITALFLSPCFVVMRDKGSSSIMFPLIHFSVSNWRLSIQSCLLCNTNLFQRIIIVIIILLSLTKISFLVK